MSINNGLSTEEIEQRRSDVRRVTGFALTQEALDIFTATNDDEIPAVQLYARQAKYLIELFNSEQRRPVNTSNAQIFLGAAIGESWMIMNMALTGDPRDLSVEQAIAIGRHERTLHAHGMMASQSNRSSSLMVENLHGTFYRITTEGNAIEMSPGVEPSTFATCPEAGPLGKVEPTPLMRRFVPWATELAVYSILRSKIQRGEPLAPNDPAEALMLAK